MWGRSDERFDNWWKNISIYLKYYDNWKEKVISDSISINTIEVRNSNWYYEWISKIKIGYDEIEISPVTENGSIYVADSMI